MNKKLLRSFMVLCGDTNLTLSKMLGISSQRFSMKLNETNGAEFTQGEIKKIMDKYNLKSAEVEAIFFNDKVSC